MSQYEDLLVDALLDYGFTLDEAVSLIELQARTDRQRQESAHERELLLWLGEDGRHLWN